MLEVSLSLVAGFAAFTAYTIIGSEIQDNRTQPKTALKPPTTSKSPSKPVVKTAKPVAAPAKKPTTAKPKAATAKTPADPVATTSKAILANLTKNGPATVAKIAKDLKADAATLQLATEKLINDKKITAIKRGGYPALALYTK
jgi:outer membrane biosynthesis protein TonB